MECGRKGRFGKEGEEKVGSFIREEEERDRESRELQVRRWKRKRIHESRSIRPEQGIERVGRKDR
jgi:hypothetical protein